MNKSNDSKLYFFYGGPFSQWYHSYFTVDGVRYCTAEQYMMAKKALFFGDELAFSEIMATESPSRQKEVGRRVRNFVVDDWNAVSRKIVFQGNMAKFGTNKDLREFMLNTGDMELVEASPTDCIWGIGLAEHDPRCLDRSQWRGTNWLGEELMNVRSELRKAS